MKLYKPILFVSVILALVAVEEGDTSMLRAYGYRHLHYAAAVIPVTLLAAPYMTGVSPFVVVLLLLKILRLKRRLLTLKMVGLGALVVAKGSSLLLGAVGGQLGTLYLLERIHRWRYPSWHHKGQEHKGWGWRPRLKPFRFFPKWRNTRPGWRPPPSYYKWPVHVTHNHSPATWTSSGYPKYTSSHYSSDSGPADIYAAPDGWSSSGHGHTDYSSPATERWSSSPHGDTAYSSPISSTSDYSVPKASSGVSDGWNSGSPLQAWESKRHEKRVLLNGSQIGTEAAREGNSEGSDFMTGGIASTSKDAMEDWFSDFTKILIKSENTLSTGPSNVEKLFSKRRVKDVIESEAFLEQEFNKLEEDDEASKDEKKNLILHLREAYMRSLLDELSVESLDQIPTFVPMPEIISSNQAESETQDELAAAESSSRKKREAVSTKAGGPSDKEQEFIQNLVEETKEYFTLLSAFDHDTCMQKLVCEVHTRVGEVKESSYDHNVISMFKLVNALLIGHYKGSSMKYREAAFYGEMNRSSDLCKKRYESCQYTAKEIMRMGNELN